MSLLKTNEIQNYNGSSLTLTASTVSTSAQLNTGGNISVTGSLNVSDDSTTRTNLGLGTIATQDSNNINLTGGTIGSGVVFPAGHVLQVVQATQVSDTTVSTTTATDITCSVSITPTNASSKIVIYAAVQIYAVASSLFITSHLYKDSSTLGSAFTKLIYNTFGGGTLPVPLIGYETAGSTSTRSYSIRGSTTGGSTWQNGVITVMEIAA